MVGTDLTLYRKFVQKHGLGAFLITEQYHIGSQCVYGTQCCARTDGLIELQHIPNSYLTRLNFCITWLTPTAPNQIEALSVQWNSKLKFNKVKARQKEGCQ